MTRLQKVFLKDILCKLAYMTVEELKEYKDKDWYKHSLQVAKFGSKKNPLHVSGLNSNLMQKKQKEFMEFTKEYYKDTLTFHVLLMYAILEYLMFEEKDTEIRGKFLHLPIEAVRKEIGRNEEFNKLDIQNSKYLAELISKIEKVNI